MNVLINKPIETLMYKINCTRLLKLEVAGVSEDYGVFKLHSVLLYSVLGTVWCSPTTVCMRNWYSQWLARWLWESIITR